MLIFDPFPEIKTDRLLLRQLRAADNLQLYAMRSDLRLMKYLDRPAAVSLAEVDLFIKHLRVQQPEGKSIMWGICLKKEPSLIGTITLWKIDPANFRAELGYMLQLNSQRQGYMQEAIRSVLDYGFKQMNLHSIQADVNPLNIPSIRLLEKAGFIREAYFRENFYYNGQFMDSAIYSVLSPL